ncbi:MAG TPA: hypothetical protein VM598_01165 [Bdellovibrionota bacterium]|nr:hypothetical protein [Bdellovibrionota bacterium]
MERAISTNTARDLGRLLSWTAGLCFIGHGAWGIITKADWLPFYAVFGIPAEIAWKLMPLTGAFDIALGLSMFFRPAWPVIGWMAIWTVVTAFLRPLSGMAHWEVWERAGNFGPPLALLVLFVSPRMSLFADGPWQTTRKRMGWARLLLLACLSSLLLGHGAFGLLVQKSLLVRHWAALGMSNPLQFVQASGAFEILLALLVLAAPSRSLYLFILAWKLGTEFLYPVAGRALDVFEFIERWGDFGIPVALMVLENATRGASRSRGEVGPEEPGLERTQTPHARAFQALAPEGSGPRRGQPPTGWAV